MHKLIIESSDEELLIMIKELIKHMDFLVERHGYKTRLEIN